VPIGFVWKEKVITFSLSEWRRGLGMLGWIVWGNLTLISYKMNIQRQFDASYLGY